MKFTYWTAEFKDKTNVRFFLSENNIVDVFKGRRPAIAPRAAAIDREIVLPPVDSATKHDVTQVFEVVEKANISDVSDTPSVMWHTAQCRSVQV